MDYRAAAERMVSARSGTTRTPEHNGRVPLRPVHAVSHSDADVLSGRGQNGPGG